jgi:hypothetical protein
MPASTYFPDTGQVITASALRLMTMEAINPFFVSGFNVVTAGVYSGDLNSGYILHPGVAVIGGNRIGNAASRVYTMTAGQNNRLWLGFDDKLQVGTDGDPTSGYTTRDELMVYTVDLAGAGAMTDVRRWGHILSGSIASGAIRSTDLQDSIVTNAKLATDAVTNTKIGSGQVITDKILDDAITAVKLDETESPTFAGLTLTGALSGTSIGVSGNINTTAGSFQIDGTDAITSGRVGNFVSTNLTSAVSVSSRTLAITGGTFVLDIYDGTPRNMDVDIDGTGKIRPVTTNYGYIGYSDRYWYAVYANYLYFKTDHASFDEFDDLAMIKNIKPHPTETIEYNIKGKKEKVPIIDKSTLPKYVLNYTDKSNHQHDNEEFIDASAMSGLLIGAVKQLIAKHEEKDLIIERLQNRIDKLEAS